MSAEIKTLRENVAELKLQSSNTDKKLDRILFILNNDDETGQKGLVAQVQDLKKGHADTNLKVDGFITEHDKQEAVKKGKLGLLAAIGGSIGTAVTLFFKYFWEGMHK